MSRSKDKGTKAESAVAEYLGYSGFPFAERQALRGAGDRGDVKVCPGVVAEVKNDKKFDYPGWLAETAREKANAGAEHAFLVVKPQGVGYTRVGLWWSVMYSRDWSALYRQAPLGAAPEFWPEVQLPGSNYKRELARLALDRTFKGLVEISATGVENELDWYIVTRLEQQVALLLAAGFGSPEVCGAGIVDR